MKKEDLKKLIAEKSELSKSTSNKALDAILQVIIEGLKREGAVSISGFGTFKVTQRAERQGRNPKTGDPITIAAAFVPSFTAAKGLKEAVKSLKVEK